MSETKKKKKSAAAPKEGDGKFVTQDQLDTFGVKLLDAIEARLDKAATQPTVVASEAKQKEEAAKAGPNKFVVNEEWEEDARKTLGDLLDHTEVVYEKNGGIKYTIVVNIDKSNAPEQYRNLVKTDRRTKEVDAGGFGAVQEWNKLVKQNLTRPGRDMRA